MVCGCQRLCHGHLLPQISGLPVLKLAAAASGVGTGVCNCSGTGRGGTSSGWLVVKSWDCCDRMWYDQGLKSPAGLPRRRLLYPEIQTHTPTPLCWSRGAGAALLRPAPYPCPGIISFLPLCSAQNKLLSKGLSHTLPPSSPSCLPSPDPAATSSPPPVDSVSPAKKVVASASACPLVPPLPACSEMLSGSVQSAGTNTRAQLG